MCQLRCALLCSPPSARAPPSQHSPSQCRSALDTARCVAGNWEEKRKEEEETPAMTQLHGRKFSLPPLHGPLCAFCCAVRCVVHGVWCMCWLDRSIDRRSRLDDGALGEVLHPREDLGGAVSGSAGRELGVLRQELFLCGSGNGALGKGAERETDRQTDRQS